MPTNLGTLVSNKPLSTGKVQVKRGATEGAITLFNTTTSGTKLGDGVGGNMEISYTPTYPCYWAVHSNVMAHGHADSVGWRRWDHGIMISPADADGVTTGFVCPHQVYDLTTVEWRSVGGSYTFRLNAGIKYTAYLAHIYLNAGRIHYYAGPQWLRIVGRIVGEMVV